MLKKNILPGSIFLIGLGFLLPAQAYEVKLLQNNIQVRSEASRRSGKLLTRLKQGKYTLSGTRYGVNGELWVQLKLSGAQRGWVLSRFVDPILNKNYPIRLIDISSPLLFDYAKRKLTYQSLTSPGVKQRIKKQLLILELAHIKQEWDLKRRRINFVELSQRVGVKGSLSELKQVQSEMTMMESQFQRLMSYFIRLF